MGSGFAGAKAGILAGIFFAGSIGAFNTLLLYMFRGEVLQALTKLTDCSSAAVAAGEAGSPDYCFSTLLSVWIPFYVFVIFVISLFFAGGFGLFFEYVPGRSYRTKAGIVTAMMIVILLLFGFEGLSASTTERVILVAFDVIVAAVYSLTLARLYRRYTREVEFQSPDPGTLKITVDGRDVTGRRRTFSTHSSHKVRAPSGTGAFKEWLVSGGVSVEDPKSFETEMHVEGDGFLKIT